MSVYWNLIVVVDQNSKFKLRLHSKVKASTLRHNSFPIAVLAAEKISAWSGIERVHISKIDERTEGVWIKGKKSR